MCLIPFVCRYLKNYNCESRFSNNFELLPAAVAGGRRLRRPVVSCTQMYLWICTSAEPSVLSIHRTFQHLSDVYYTAQSLQSPHCIQTMRIHSQAKNQFEYKRRRRQQTVTGIERREREKINIRLLCAYCPFISKSSEAVDAIPHTFTQSMLVNDARACVNTESHKIDK